MNVYMEKQCDYQIVDSIIQFPFLSLIRNVYIQTRKFINGELMAFSTNTTVYYIGILDEENIGSILHGLCAVDNIFMKRIGSMCVKTLRMILFSYGYTQHLFWLQARMFVHPKFITSESVIANSHA